MPAGCHLFVTKKLENTASHNMILKNMIARILCRTNGQFLSYHLRRCLKMCRRLDSCHLKQAIQQKMQIIELST